MPPSPRAEYDSCAIIAFIDKQGRSTHANIIRTIDGLRKMGHRSGDINGEGDGCGISIDIPRRVWARRLATQGNPADLLNRPDFFVAHLLLPLQQAPAIMAAGRDFFRSQGLQLLAEVAGNTRNDELGARARGEAPFFWQIAGLTCDPDPQQAGRRLFGVQLALESRPDLNLHVSSLSLDSVIFKVQGQPDLLPRVYPELLDPEVRSVIALGHSRYSTNTLPTVLRSQPFGLLGHNGEINTIERLEEVGRSLGIPPVEGGSDSQNLDRLLAGLIARYGLDLSEAAEMVFPAIHSETAAYPPELQELYRFYRWFFPASAQGPAAVIARHAGTCLGSVDALGLRPLWFGESDYDYFFSSEKGVVDLKTTMIDPKPLAPGEKIAVQVTPGQPARVLSYDAMQRRLLELQDRRTAGRHCKGRLHSPAALDSGTDRQAGTVALPAPLPGLLQGEEHLLAALGWQHYDQQIRRKVAHGGREVIGSLGHTGPLALLMEDHQVNLADYCKENVAVVTNPAIDREREADHFSTAVILGPRPQAMEAGELPAGLELGNPLLLESGLLKEQLAGSESRELAGQFGTLTLEQVIDFFQGQTPGNVRMLDATFRPGEGLESALQRLTETAAAAVEQGAGLLVVDDSSGFQEGRVPLDPVLSTARLAEMLIRRQLRRKAGLVVRSAMIRNLHDIMLLLGLGADALSPYLLWRTTLGQSDREHPPYRVVHNTMSVLQKGMEKVMSTMGIHELTGYGRVFASIGLAPELAAGMRLVNFCGSDQGLNFRRLEAAAGKRLELAGTQGNSPILREPARNPRVGKILRQTAEGRLSPLQMAEELAKVEEELPTGLRHLLGFAPDPAKKRLLPHQVDMSIGDHDLPLVIAAMSFGSQGENSFRTYAEAGRRANIVCMNGEGGEIPDMLGRYRRNRGQQIASGRFGVSMDFLNSADFLEIKIGQGAKPGEGGHLPGTKVSEMVARARHCKPGITLISPSNHHDIYSIEDLAQIITELKTANPLARVSVKIPVTSNVGTIAVGIAKAGADIVNLSGYEGGTGAAREHAKKYVGLPVEIGVSEAHRALTAAGLRPQVELWADGGIRSGAEVVKLVLLGANRVGLGTAVLMAIGCISCRQCHLDRCPRGISTQLRSVEEARGRGVRVFKPREVEEEAENLARLLRSLGEEIRYHLAGLGEPRLQDLVGRTDLLRQVRLQERLDLAPLLAAPGPACAPEWCLLPRVVRKPLNYLTKLIADLLMERLEAGRERVRFTDDEVRSTDRAVGTYLAGAVTRRFGRDFLGQTFLELESSVPGNGLAAFTIPGLAITTEGGSQDGAAKGSSGGVLTVLKGKNILGRRVDGSTGKSFGYGATGGLLILQNLADSRACIRMSGADAVFGARITEPVRDSAGNIATRAHLKGFAFEYMTGGRAVVLGDPGPWICSGMTGGVVYQCLYPEFGFEQQAVVRRLARGALVSVSRADEEGLQDIRALLEPYIAALQSSLQTEEATMVTTLLAQAADRFLMIKPSPQRTLPAE